MECELIEAVLRLQYPKEAFLEYCAEHDVRPDIDLLRSWLIERVISDNASENLVFICSDHDHDQDWYAALS